MTKCTNLTMKEYEKKRNFAIGYASALFAEHILTDKNKFNKFLSMISEEDKNLLLKFLLTAEQE